MPFGYKHLFILSFPAKHGKPPAENNNGIRLATSKDGRELPMLTRTFYWFLLACELAAIVLLVMGLVEKVKRIIERS